MRWRLITVATVLVIGQALDNNALAQSDLHLAACLRAGDPTRDKLEACAAAADDWRSASGRADAFRRAQEIRTDLGDDSAVLVAAERRLAENPADPRALDDKASALLVLGRKGDDEAALAATEHGLSLHPGDVGLMATRVYALANLGRKDEAMAAAERTVALSPRSVAALRARAAMRIGRDDVPGATRDLDLARSVAPDDLGVARSRLRLLAVSEDWPRLAAEADAVIARAPDHPRVHVWRAVAGLQLRDHARALAAIDAAIARQPDQAAYHYLRSQIIEPLQGRRMAVAALDRVVQLDPAHFWALNDRAFHRTILEDYAAAKADAAAARRLRPDEPKTRLTAAMIALYGDGRPQEALDLLEPIRGAQPPIGDVHFLRATALMRLSRFPDAIIALDLALAIRPDRPSYLAQRGEANWHAKRLDAALADLDRAITLGHRTRDALFRRGILHLQKGEAAKSAADFEAVLALDPKDAAALANRAVARFDLKAYNEAERDARAAIALDSKDIGARVTLGRVVRDRDRDFPRALKLFDEALALDRDHGRTHFERAIVFVRTERNAEAMSSVEAALARDPENRLYINLRGEIHYLARRLGPAKADLTRAIELGLRDANPYFFRALVHIQNSDFGAARADVDRAIAIDGGQVRTQALKAALSLRDDDLRLTLVVADRALELESNNQLALNVRAVALERLGRSAEAAQALARSRGIDAKLHEVARTTVQGLAGVRR